MKKLLFLLLVSIISIDSYSQKAIPKVKRYLVKHAIIVDTIVYKGEKVSLYAKDHQTFIIVRTKDNIWYRRYIPKDL